MFSSLAVVVLVSSATPVRIAAPGLQVVNLEARLGDFYSEHLAQQLKYTGLEVMTGREIASLLGLERQKQLLGCSDTSCMTELVNALGADGVMLGDLARVGDRFQLNVKIISSGNGHTLALFSSAAATEGALLDVMADAAKQLARDVSLALGRPLPSSGGVRRYAWAPLALGVAATGAGVACLIVSGNAHQTLLTGSPGAEGQALKTTGQLTGTLGVIGTAVGGAALVTATLMFILGAESPVAVSGSVSPTGASVSLGGVFP